MNENQNQLTNLTMPDVFIRTPSDEQETIINMSRDNKTASIYTSDNVVLTALKKKIANAPNAYKLIKVYTDSVGPYAIDVICPKKLIGFKTPKVLTEEQRAAAIARLAASRVTETTSCTELEDESDGEDADIT